MSKMQKKVKRAFFPYSDNDFQPQILKPRSLFCLSVVLLLVKFLIFSWLVYFPTTAQFAIVTSSNLVNLTNQERISLGLNALKISDKLVRAAEEKARDMLNKNYFAHTSPEGTTPWHWLEKNGYNYIAAGENLAKNFNDSKFLHKAWMNSPSHKENITNNKYQEIGIAVVEGIVDGKKIVIAVQYFGRTLASQPVMVAEEQPEPGPESQLQPKPETEQPILISDTEIQKQEISLTEIGEDIKESVPAQIQEIENNENFLGAVSEKSESFTQKFYFIILGLLILVLLLTIFINVRVQYPKTIFTATIFIVLIAAIALFNSKELLNQGIEVLSAII